ncbi:radical SAM/SPASM domain-containing protein [Kordiimonas aestuarii]|uniref:radical SAM/SPASM domain-containing protein n=1 Tax=Kordiimonas aestuarii TaxID=1005925 RepID=UPI0021D123BA|nr:SPASM domain-containing protein [Kordiimonas aestuarii]
MAPAQENPGRWLEVTTVVGCRVACAYCPQKALTSSYRHISKTIALKLEDFKHFLTSVPTDVKLAFSGYSEPFLNPDCVALMQYASTKGHKLIASSTLEGMTVEQAEQVVDIPFERFLVHLANDMEQERITLDQRYFDILDIFQGHPDFRFHSDGYKVHRDVEHHLVSYALRKVHSRAGNVPQDNEIDVTQERLETIHMQGPITCDRLNGNVLLPNGNVALCCMDFGLRHVIGNLATDSYEDLFTSPEYKRVQQQMLSGGQDILCRTCHKAVPITN